MTEETRPSVRKELQRILREMRYIPATEARIYRQQYAGLWLKSAVHMLALLWPDDVRAEAAEIIKAYDELTRP